MNPVIIIPARLGSTRLPGKPLADICGKPMIIRVMERALRADVAPVYVACGEEEIARAVQTAGGQAILTDPALPSGSDRVHAAVSLLDPDKKYDVVVNLQGDLPLIPSGYLATVLKPLEESRFDIATLVSPFNSRNEAEPTSVVKAACVFQSEKDFATALYFSRSVVPSGEGPLWHHMGVYAYRRLALEAFVKLPPSGLELREKLEQLRAIEAGFRIGCARVNTSPFEVDTPADLERARKLTAAQAI